MQTWSCLRWAGQALAASNPPRSVASVNRLGKGRLPFNWRHAGRRQDHRRIPAPPRGQNLEVTQPGECGAHEGCRIVIQRCVRQPSWSTPRLPGHRPGSGHPERCPSMRLHTPALPAGVSRVDHLGGGGCGAAGSITCRHSGDCRPVWSGRDPGWRLVCIIRARSTMDP